MSVKASMSTRLLSGGTVCIYFEDERLEIGTSSFVCQEELKRVAYRDVSRIVTWPATRRPFLYVGIGLLLLALLGVALFAAIQDPDLAFILVGVGMVFALGIFCVYTGRRDGITHLRVDGVRGSVEAVLDGSKKKRRRVLEELERRIRDRQATR